MATPGSFCPACGNAVSSSTGYCDYCGQNLTPGNWAEMAAPPTPPTGPSAAASKSDKWVFDEQLEQWVAKQTASGASAVAAPAGVVQAPQRNYVYAEISAAYNQLVAAENDAVERQNSADVATSVAGIQTRIANHQNFSQHVRGMRFPDFMIAEITQLLNDNATLEQMLRAMAVALNTHNIEKYNEGMAAANWYQTAVLNDVNKLGFATPPTGPSAALPKAGRWWYSGQTQQWVEIAPPVPLPVAPAAPSKAGGSGTSDAIGKILMVVFLAGFALIAALAFVPGFLNEFNSIFSSGGGGGSPYYLHWNCGRVAQCGQVMGRDTGHLSVTFSSRAECQAQQDALAVNRMQKGPEGGPGTWCDRLFSP